jgi:TonB family protein
MRATVALVFLLLLATTAQASSPCRECIKRPVQAKAKELRRCYSELLTRAAPDTQGRVVVVFTIERTGRTSRVTLKRNDLKDRKFARCVVEVFETLRFAKPPEPMHISYPLLFRPKD